MDRNVIAAAAAALTLISTVFPAAAWDGFDYENGASVEIESGNLVRPGRDIEFFDYEAGEYRYGTVESMSNLGSGVEVEVFDYEAGEVRTFEMDD